MNKNFIFVSVIIAISALSFFAGVSLGTNSFLLANSQYDAALTVFELRKLRSGRVQEVVALREQELLGQVSRHREYEQSFVPKLLWPELASPTGREMLDVEEYLIDFGVSDLNQ